MKQKKSPLISFAGRIVAVYVWIIMTLLIFPHNALSSGDDEYEPDNELQDAKAILVNDPRDRFAHLNYDRSQLHNFFLENDVDWVKFYAQQGLHYTVDVTDVSANCDVAVGIYNTNGELVIPKEKDDWLAGQNEYAELDCDESGIYYARIRQCNPDEQEGCIATYGEKTDYRVALSIPIAPSDGLLHGMIYPYGINDVRITTNEIGPPGPFLDVIYGSYELYHPRGETTINITADDCLPYSERIYVNEIEDTRVDIRLTPVTAGYEVAPDLWIRAVIHTDDKGEIEGQWKLGGQNTTERGDQVIWGYFFAHPLDEDWGSVQNPDLFVKIWKNYPYDEGCPNCIFVDYFHVSVPEISVYTDFYYNGTPNPDESSRATLDNRFVEHRYEQGITREIIQIEDGIPCGDCTASTNPAGANLLHDLKIGATVNTEDKGPVEATWYLGGKATTDRNDEVIWGYFYVDPKIESWGSKDNPDLFVKIWFDVSGRVDVNFFHVSVPDIEVFSELPVDGQYDNKGRMKKADRYIMHQY